MNKADQEQSDLIEYTLNFHNKARPKKRDDKKKNCSYYCKISL